MAGRVIEQKIDSRVAALAGGDPDPRLFYYVGLEWLEFFIQYGRLTPWGTVLDIGCGTGRMALPLSYYLSDDGALYGFDVSQESIGHCQSEIRHRNFCFQKIDLWHQVYNPTGAIHPSTFIFPFNEEFFDLVFAASIFTHIDNETVANYLIQIYRVLNRGGRAIISFHAVPPSAMCAEGGVTALIGVGDGEWAYRFRNRGQGYYTHCDEQGRPKNHYLPDPIGDPVAYEREIFESWCSSAKLIVRNFLPGAWNGSPYHYGWQDMLVLEKAY